MVLGREPGGEPVKVMMDMAANIRTIRSAGIHEYQRGMVKQDASMLRGTGGGGGALTT